MNAKLLAEARMVLLAANPTYDATDVLRMIVEDEEAKWRKEVLTRIEAELGMPGVTVEFKRDPGPAREWTAGGWETFSPGPLTITIRCPR